MADFLGVVAIIFFYVLILIVGIWAGRKSKVSILVEDKLEISKRKEEFYDNSQEQKYFRMPKTWPTQKERIQKK